MKIFHLRPLLVAISYASAMLAAVIAIYGKELFGAPITGMFIAAGAFNVSKPSDLLPEFQGRFPIRVELDSLSMDDFVRILTEPQNALIIQYKALLDTEGIELLFEDSAIREIASMASDVNERTENIGARRLHTVMEKLLDEISYDAPDMTAKSVPITKKYVEEKLADILEDENLSRYIL